MRDLRDRPSAKPPEILLERMLNDPHVSSPSVRNLFGFSSAGTINVRIRSTKVAARPMVGSYMSSYQAFTPRLIGRVEPSTGGGSIFKYRIVPSPYSWIGPAGLLLAIASLVVAAIVHVAAFLVIGGVLAVMAAWILLLGAVFRKEKDLARAMLADWVERISC